MQRAALIASLAGAALACACQPQARPVIFPDTINLKVPAGARVNHDCLRLLAPDQADARKAACVYFLDPKGTEPDGWRFVSPEATEAYVKAMNEAGWVFAHLAVVEHYFERPIAGGDCSQVAVLVTIPGAELKKVVDADASAGGYDGKPWRGYFIPAEPGEACGDERKAGPRRERPAEEEED